MLMVGPRRGARNSTRSSRFGRLTNRYNRWFVGGSVAILLLLLISLAWVPLPGPLSGGRGFFETLDRSLFTAAALALAAYFWFNFWTTHWATRELLEVAQRTPERLFPHAPEAGSANQVFGRKRLVGEITNSLRAPGAGPQIVVGGTGSGKTTLLLSLASHLANEHYIVPIVLSLRDRSNDLEKNDFTELAVRRFEDLVDPYIKSNADADKLWRWMCNRGRIVILADDLDRSTQVNDQDPYRTQIRLALDAARRRSLPMVVTTRPSGLPPDLSEVPIDLSDFGLEGKKRAARYVLKRAGRTGGEARGLVERNIEKGDLLENAFYLTLLARLLRVDALPEPARGGRHAVRIGLLSADRRRLCGEGVLDENDAAQRDEALCGVEDLAAAWLVPADEVRFNPRWLRAVRDGERFGLLSLDDRGRPQFKHEVLHAYYASRAIVKRSAPWQAMLDKRPSGARVQLTLVLAAVGGGSRGFCRAACERLLAEVKGLSPDQHLLRASGAAELAKAGRFSERDGQIAERCLQKKDDAGPVAKRAALAQLEKLGGKGAVDALWAYAQDDDYGTRWTAVECLVRRCSREVGSGGEKIREPFKAEAYAVIEPKIEEALEGGRSLLAERRRPDDSDRKIILLKQLAWMLPSLRTGAKNTALRERIEVQLQELLRLERQGVTSQRGLEASVAQGFKTDARLHPEEPPDPYAKEMLRERAVFWYSQLNLVHALALRMAGNSNWDADSLAAIVTEVRRRERARMGGWNGNRAVDGDLHPMLRYAAKLCERALKGKAGETRVERVTRVVWKDEGVVVSRRPRKLDRAAAQLVGEITVLLNLNETGSPEQRERFGEGVVLPYCLQGSRRRREFHEGCKDGCGFGLCPFQPARDEPSAHRELSRAFCRDQRLHANLRTSRRWGARVVPRALPEFWRWLEAQARY